MAGIVDAYLAIFGFQIAEIAHLNWYVAGKSAAHR